MFLSGIEQVAYDKGIAIGEKKGEERGEKKGEKKMAKKIFNRLIKDGWSEKDAYKLVYGEELPNKGSD